MKFEVTVERGETITDHYLQVSLDAGALSEQGKARFVFDGAAAEADWAEVRPGVYSLIIGARSREVRVQPARTEGRDASFEIVVGTERLRVSLHDPRMRRRAAPAAAHGPQELLAPMPGRVVKILVNENAGVKAGEGLLVIEAMKMQNEVRAPRAGRIDKIHVREGEGVETGARLAVLV